MSRGSSVSLVVTLLICTSHGFRPTPHPFHTTTTTTLRSTATLADSNPRTHGLALQLDEGTRSSHSIAENSKFVTGFFKGISTDSTFAALVTSLYYVYEAMESAFDASTSPHVKALDFPQLRRLPSLEQDMAFFYGPSWRTTSSPSPATAAYVSQINSVASSPHLLIAHMYELAKRREMGGGVLAFPHLLD